MITRLSKMALAAVVTAPLTLGAYVAKAESSDIVETVESFGYFATLVKAVKAAGLEDTLKEDGPYTVFAPTDSAFASLPEGKLEKSLELSLR